MKLKLTLGIVLGSFLMAGIAVAAPSFIFQPSIIPQTDSLYTLGTTSRAWLNIHTDQICLAGDCQTAWPSGSGSGFSTTSANFWSSVGLGFSTTSTNYWESTQAARGADGTFSTTSASYFSSLGLAHSTTSADTWLTTKTTANLTENTNLYYTDTRVLTALTAYDKGFFFSTTSTNYWKTQNTFEALTAGDGLTRTADDFDCDTASGTVFGCLSSANWTTFNNKENALTFNYPLTRSVNTISFPATSTLYGTGTAGQVLMWSGSTPIWAATSTGGTGTVTNIATTYPLTGGPITTTGTLALAFGTTTANTWSLLNNFGNATSTLFTATTAWIDTLNLTNDLTVANGGTGASTLTGLLQGNGTGAITGGATISDTNWSGTDLSVANGGTGASTLTGVLQGNGTSAFTAVSATTCTNQFVRAMSALYVATCATVDISADTNLAVTAPITLTGDTLSLGNVKQYPAFSYSTTTAWTGTTTIPLGTAYVAETWNGVQCFTDVGTLNVSFNDGTNHMTLLNASTTVGTVTLSTNNAFTAAEKRYVDIGTPATAPQKISCTVSKTLSVN